MSAQLTKDDPERFILFPIEYPDIWEMYEKQKGCFWWPEDVCFSQTDEEDWESLSPEERYFMENILAFFAGADGIVMENLAQRFMHEITIAEARAFLTIQNMIELTHSLTYAKLLDGYIKDPKRKRELFRANQNISFIKEKTDWATKWTNADRPLSERLVAFACVEGIHFQGEFCAIFWFKEKRKLPALTTANYLISRDENLHTQNICALYNRYADKLEDARVREIVEEAVSIEKNFINQTLNCRLLGMNADLMGTYIEYVADYVCSLLGHPKIYNSPNPFPFMERLAFDVKENFFETKVTSYQVPVREEIGNIDVLDSIDFSKF